MQAAIDAGYAGAPDPRCRLAEILLRAGRAAEAHRIFAEVKAETPDDVWLYNNAGLEYGAAGDHERAVAWLAEGLQLALDTGDPERLVAQMSDLRRESLAALGRELDELEARADEFLAQPQPPKPAWQPQELPGVLAALDAAQGSALAPTAAVPPSKSSGDRMVLALSWFPREEFAAALEAWPQLADDWGTADHTEYNRRLQRHLSEMPTHAWPGVDRPDPRRSPAQLVLTHGQRPGIWVCAFGLRRRARPHGIGRAHRLAAGSQRTVLVRQRAQVQALLRAPERRCDTSGAVMARTWLSIRVDLVEGGGHDSIWPRPGRIFAAARSHTFGQLATAIDDAFARWDRSHLHSFDLRGTLLTGSCLWDEAALTAHSPATG